MRQNYLKRFDDVKDIINKGNVEIIKEFGKINNSITALGVEIKNHIKMEMK